MGSMLDVIGALVIGGMFIITMMTSIFKIQQLSYNSNMLTTLNKTSELVTRVIDYEYLARLGNGLKDKSSIITEANDTTFTFRYKKATAIIPVSMQLRTHTTISNIYNFGVYVNSSATPSLGTFLLEAKNTGTGAKKSIFTYYNENDARIMTPNDSLQYIRSMRLSLYFVYEGRLTGAGVGVDKRYRNQIYLWKYFNNMWR